MIITIYKKKIKNYNSEHFTFKMVSSILNILIHTVIKKLRNRIFLKQWLQIFREKNNKN